MWDRRTRGRKSTSPSAKSNVSVSADSVTSLPLFGNAALAASATPSQAAGKKSNKAGTVRERRSTPANTTSTHTIASTGRMRFASVRGCVSGNPPGNSSRAATAAAPCAHSTIAQNITATTRATFMPSNRVALVSIPNLTLAQRLENNRRDFRRSLVHEHVTGAVKQVKLRDSAVLGNALMNRFRAIYGHQGVLRTVNEQRGAADFRRRLQQLCARPTERDVHHADENLGARSEQREVCFELRHRHVV